MKASIMRSAGLMRLLVDGETAGLEPYRDNQIRLLKREVGCCGCHAEAWERVVSTSQSKARARIKVGNANRAGDLAIKES